MGFVVCGPCHHTCRPHPLFRRWRCIRALIALIGTVVHTSVVDAQETPIAEPSATIQTESTKQSGPREESHRERRLQFAFEGTRWREVLTWLADQAGLALHVQDLPVGSFTYSDPKSFTHQEAIDRINLFLLSQGYTIIRSGTLLSVINLSDSRSLQQLDVLANLITLNQLDKLPDHEVVKCMFSLDTIKAEDAVEELTALKLMTTPVVFEKTNRLMITDTVRKLKSVKIILDAFEPLALDSGMVMKTFALQHVEAEDILVVARPHLGLATGEMIGIDVSLSADIQGNTIFVTGVDDKVKLIEGLITSLDKPTKSLSSIDGGAELRSHIIEGGNAETVHNVLQTLLAGKAVRLSVDAAAGSIVALASRDIQEEIAKTVAQLQASEAEFEIIQLKTVDPYLVISLLEEMLDLSELRAQAAQSQNQSRGDFGRRGDRGRSVSPNIKVDIPKIDADPGNMRLFVRAKKHQLEQIKKIVAKLDVSSAASNDKIRIFPLSGKQAQQVLETAAKFWRAPNPIILYRPTKQSQPDNTERVLTNESTETKRTDLLTTDPEMPNARVLTDNIDSQAPAIRCQFTSRGLLLQSDDTVALDQFEKHLRTIAGTVRSMTSPPIVFYLKYTKPDDAIRMLGELLDGGDSASEGEAGSLVNGYVLGSSGTFLGSLVTSRDGTTTMTAGTVTVVADSRLNRLIAQGTTSDIEQSKATSRSLTKTTASRRLKHMEPHR